MSTSLAPAPSPAADEIDPAAGVTPLERLELLCDPGSLHVIRSDVASLRMRHRSEPGDGVVGAAGAVSGRPVFCYAQDASYAGGSLGAAHAYTIVRLQRLAAQARAPIVGFIESAGARMQEGTAALAGYGRIFHASVALTSQVPQVSVVTGASAGGGCYSPALTDFVVMTKQARMFLTGPTVVREALGEEVTAAELGGPAVHERNGVCDFVVKGDLEATALARQLLSYLPQSVWDLPPVAPAIPPPDGDPGRYVPSDPRAVYDVRDVVGCVVDGGKTLEIAPKWAPNMVTAVCRIDGRPVGVVANQPRHLGGVVDADAAEKAARFVRLCDRFRWPLIVFVDTPGFMPGRRQETAGVIRKGAALLHAFADASVPRVSVVLRKAYGGAFITMNSKDLGAHMTFAWRGAEIGVMGARQAVAIIHRGELDAASDPGLRREELARAYAADHLSSDLAARDGFLDELIDPLETRGRLVWALNSIPPQDRRRGDHSDRFTI